MSYVGGAKQPLPSAGHKPAADRRIAQPGRTGLLPGHDAGLRPQHIVEPRVVEVGVVGHRARLATRQRARHPHTGKLWITTCLWITASWADRIEGNVVGVLGLDRMGSLAFVREHDMKGDPATGVGSGEGQDAVLHQFDHGGSGDAEDLGCLITSARV